MNIRTAAHLDAYVDSMRYISRKENPWSASHALLPHPIDTTPLPAIVPRSGKPPQVALLLAISRGDLDAFRRELETDTSRINDVLERAPLKGKTLLHLVANVAGVNHDNHQVFQTCSAMAELLLAKGANPVARDANGLFASTYTGGHTPTCLRDRMLREAAEERVGQERVATAMEERRRAETAARRCRREQAKARTAQ